jgi:hypothetical protein
MLVGELWGHVTRKRALTEKQRKTARTRQEMSTDKKDSMIGRSHREHRDAVDQRLQIVERAKQIADALKRLANAIDRKPDFEEVSKDSILQQYLRIALLVIEEQELTEKIGEYSKRLIALGFAVCH